MAFMRAGKRRDLCITNTLGTVAPEGAGEGLIILNEYFGDLGNELGVFLESKQMGNAGYSLWRGWERIVFPCVY